MQAALPAPDRAIVETHGAYVTLNVPETVNFKSEPSTGEDVISGRPTGRPRAASRDRLVILDRVDVDIEEDLAGRVRIAVVDHEDLTDRHRDEASVGLERLVLPGLIAGRVLRGDGEQCIVPASRSTIWPSRSSTSWPSRRPASSVVLQLPSAFGSGPTHSGRHRRGGCCRRAKGRGPIVAAPEHPARRRPRFRCSRPARAPSDRRSGRRVETVVRTTVGLFIRRQLRTAIRSGHLRGVLPGRGQHEEPVWRDGPGLAISLGACMAVQPGLWPTTML